MPAKKEKALIVQDEQPLATEVSQPMKLIELAISQNFDLDKFERLFELQERWEKNQSKKAFDQAFSNFQAELPVVPKTKTAKFETRNGGTMEYSYASIDDVVKALTPVLPKHGLSYRFEQVMSNNVIKIICILTHADGHSVSCSMQGFPDQSGNKNPLQQIASTVSYLKKYTLSNVTGLACVDDDNDGNYQQLNQQLDASQPQGQDVPALEYYPDEEFNKYKDFWVKQIKELNGITADRIIAKIESKYAMTDDQKYYLHTV